MKYPTRTNWPAVIVALAALLTPTMLISQERTGQSAKPTITITEIPPYDEGGPKREKPIAGEVTGVSSKDCRVVIYSYAGDIWWVQPTVAAPHTKIVNGTWDTDIHLGRRYAALLVKSSYRPAAKLQELPEVGGDLLAITTVRGKR